MKQENIVELEEAWLKEVCIENAAKAWDKAKKEIVADTTATAVYIKNTMWEIDMMYTKEMMNKIMLDIKYIVATRVITQLMITIEVRGAKDSDVKYFVAKILSEIETEQNETKFNQNKQVSQNIQNHMDLEVWTTYIRCMGIE